VSIEWKTSFVSRLYLMAQFLYRGLVFRATIVAYLYFKFIEDYYD
jgi:hypothetical protein